MYNYSTLSIIYSSLHLAVLASVRYWLYKDRLRVPIKWMFIILPAITITGGGIWLLTGGVAGITFDTYRVALAVFMFALSCCIIKAPFAEHAFSYSFVLAYDAALETTAFFVQLNIVPDAPSCAYPAVSALIVAVTLLPGVKSLKSMITRLSELGSDSIWGWLDLACFSFLFMNLMVTMPHPASMELYYPIGRYMMLLGMVGIYKAAVRMMDTLRTAAAASAELSLTRRRVTIQQSYYDRITAQMDEVRRMRHDLRHHRAALSALIQNGDIAALSAYIDGVAVAEETLIVTGNMAADSILLYYFDAAKTLGTQVESSISLGRETPLSDPDLCVILGNLLENAVDAQNYVPQKQRYIRVTAKGSKNSLTLAVDNRFDGTLNVSASGGCLSRKTNGEHGFGINSVRAVCEKYGGILQIETDDTMFMAGVVIGI